MDTEIASKQSQAIIQKATYWLNYIDILVKEVHSERQFPLLRMASLWASTFAYIEWLATFYLYKVQPSTGEIADTLQQCLGWDAELGKLFWKSGRHPVAHVGKANSFHSYFRFNNLPTSVSLDAGRCSEAVAGEWSRHHPNKAVAILPPLDMGDGEFQIVTFHHQMLRDELLPLLAECVAEKIATEDDQGKLQKIVRLNTQIPH